MVDVKAGTSGNVAWPLARSSLFASREPDRQRGGTEIGSGAGISGANTAGAQLPRSLPRDRRTSLIPSAR